MMVCNKSLERTCGELQSNEDYIWKYIFLTFEISLQKICSTLLLHKQPVRGDMIVQLWQTIASWKV
jgi:hypothetical protein